MTRAEAAKGVAELEAERGARDLKAAQQMERRDAVLQWVMGSEEGREFVADLLFVKLRLEMPSHSSVAMETQKNAALGDVAKGLVAELKGTCLGLYHQMEREKK